MCVVRRRVQMDMAAVLQSAKALQDLTKEPRPTGLWFCCQPRPKAFNRPTLGYSANAWQAAEITVTNGTSVGCEPPKLS